MLSQLTKVVIGFTILAGSMYVVYQMQQNKSDSMEQTNSKSQVEVAGRSTFNHDGKTYTNCGGCVFPFTHIDTGRIYKTCKQNDYGVLWCSRTAEYRHPEIHNTCLNNNNHDHGIGVVENNNFVPYESCPEYVPDQCGGCVFPFYAYGKRYDKCTTDYGGGKSWCSQQTEFEGTFKWCDDEFKKWTQCAPKYL